MASKSKQYKPGDKVLAPRPVGAKKTMVPCEGTITMVIPHKDTGVSYLIDFDGEAIVCEGSKDIQEGKKNEHSDS